MKSISVRLIALAMSGCSGSRNSIVGTWHASRHGAESEFHFFPDGKLKTSVSFSGIISNTEGTYTYNGSSITIRNTVVNVIGPEPQASEMKAKLLEPGTDEVKWTNPAMFAMPMPDGPDPLVFMKINSTP